MELPTWAYDEHLAAATEGALKVALAVYRHGSPQVDSRGNRRAYWRGTKPALARTARLSKRTVDSAVGELVLAGLMALHRTTVPTAGIAISVYVDRPTGAEFTPPSESETAPHDGVNEIPSLIRDLSSITTTSNVKDAERGAEYAPLFADLAAEGVTVPADWLARFGADRCERALRALDHARERGQIRNAAGFMRALLASPRPIPEPPEPPRSLDQARRFLGDYAHLAYPRRDEPVAH